MNRSRVHRPIAVVVVLLALTASACSARTTTPSDGASVGRPTDAAGATGSAAPVQAATSEPGVLGGGLMLVLQLDNVSPDKATAQNAWTFDLGTG
jgi:hypothetical protein